MIHIYFADKETGPKVMEHISYGTNMWQSQNSNPGSYLQSPHF